MLFRGRPAATERANRHNFEAPLLGSLPVRQTLWTVIGQSLSAESEPDAVPMVSAWKQELSRLRSAAAAFESACTMQGDDPEETLRAYQLWNQRLEVAGERPSRGNWPPWHRRAAPPADNGRRAAGSRRHRNRARRTGEAGHGRAGHGLSGGTGLASGTPSLANGLASATQNYGESSAEYAHAFCHGCHELSRSHLGGALRVRRTGGLAAARLSAGGRGAGSSPG